MHSFYAATGKLAKMGGLDDCFEWAQNRLEQKQAKSVQILKARAEDREARIIGEVTSEGFKPIGGGRYVPLYRLRKAEKDGAEKE